MQKKMLFLTFALGACCALPSVAPAAPEAKGEIVKTLEFTDQNGQNSVVLRLTGEFTRPYGGWPLAPRPQEGCFEWCACRIRYSQQKKIISP